LTVDGAERIDQCIFVSWLRDSGGNAAFLKAIRAILATTGEELMLDTPKDIYEDTTENLEEEEEEEGDTKGGDIWGGSILLNHRTELLTMVVPPAQTP
jgi:hypothetical protein